MNKDEFLLSPALCTWPVVDELFGISAAVFHRAGLDWFSLESENFRIHFHEGLADKAREVLA